MREEHPTLSPAPASRGAVPPDLKGIAKDLLEIAVVCSEEAAGGLEAEYLIHAASQLDQIHQAGTTSPGGLTVDEILRRLDAEIRHHYREADSQQFGEKYSHRKVAHALEDIESWIKSWSKPKPGVTGAGQPASGEAVAEEQQQAALHCQEPCTCTYPLSLGGGLLKVLPGYCWSCDRWRYSDEGGADPSAEGDVESQAPGG